MFPKLFTRAALPPRLTPLDWLDRVEAAHGTILDKACDAIMHSWPAVPLALPGPTTVSHPPSAAMVALEFRRERPGAVSIDIPCGTRVAASLASGRVGPTFMTGRAARIEPGQESVRVLAYHAEFVQADRLGVTSGDGGRWHVARGPIVAATAMDLQLLVGIAYGPDSLGPNDRTMWFDGRAFWVWSETHAAGDLASAGPVFTADRLSGEIHIAPHERLAERRPDNPSLGHRRECEVRAWYWRGGGASGNVGANVVTLLRDSIAGVEVTNPEPARGGRDAAPAARVSGDTPDRAGISGMIPDIPAPACR